MLQLFLNVAACSSMLDCSLLPLMSCHAVKRNREVYLSMIFCFGFFFFSWGQCLFQCVSMVEVYNKSQPETGTLKRQSLLKWSFFQRKCMCYYSPVDLGENGYQKVSWGEIVFMRLIKNEDHDFI